MAMIEVQSFIRGLAAAFTILRTRSIWDFNWHLVKIGSLSRDAFWRLHYMHDGPLCIPMSAAVRAPMLCILVSYDTHGLPPYSPGSCDTQNASLWPPVSATEPASLLCVPATGYGRGLGQLLALVAGRATGQLSQ